MTAKIDSAPALTRRWLALNRRFPLRPIASDESLDAALAIINELIDMDARTPDEEDYLEVLGGLVERYEELNHPMIPVSGVDMLRFLIDTNRKTQRQVAAESGLAESTLSQILAGKREMSLGHIKALAKLFHVKPAVFLGD